MMESTLLVLPAPFSVAPGEGKTWSTQFYAGPKDQNRMAEISPNLNLTVDYGFFLHSRTLFLASRLVVWFVRELGPRDNFDDTDCQISALPAVSCRL